MVRTRPPKRHLRDRYQFPPPIATQPAPLTDRHPAPHTGTTTRRFGVHRIGRAESCSDPPPPDGTLGGPPIFYGPAWHPHTPPPPAGNRTPICSGNDPGRWVERDDRVEARPGIRKVRAACPLPSGTSTPLHAPSPRPTSRYTFWMRGNSHTTPGFGVAQVESRLGRTFLMLIRRSSTGFGVSVPSGFLSLPLQPVRAKIDRWGGSPHGGCVKVYGIEYRTPFRWGIAPPSC